MQKKGLVEVQFNWIFILIVGVAILLFFISASFWYKDNENRKIASQVMVKLQTAITGSGQSSRTATQMEIPNVELNFRCDANECSGSGCASDFMFEDTGVAKDTTMDIIFTPNTIESNYLHIWTQEFKVPYKVTNFMYFSSPSVRYFVVYNENDDSAQISQRFYEKLKKNSFLEVARIKSSEITSIAYNNEYLLRFVVFSGLTNVNPSNSVKMGTWDAIFVSGNLDHGTVTFGKKAVNGNQVPDSTKSYPYLGTTSLIGAMYSEEYGMYECNMKKALLRLQTVNDVYLERTKALYDIFAGDGKCQYYYDTDVQNMFVNIGNAASNHENPQFSTIHSMIGELDLTNTQTIRKSCPRIF